MTGVIGGDCPVEWRNINTFKQHCQNQLNEYVDGNDYDPLAVCVALREIIERNVYNDLRHQNEQDEFLSVHGTAKKLDYAEEHGVNVPELYYVLGNIYNDPLHVNEKNQKSISQTLYSRMENNTIRNMIRFVRDEAIERID